MLIIIIIIIIMLIAFKATCCVDAEVVSGAQLQYWRLVYW